jgi:hypothetical protein
MTKAAFSRPNGSNRQAAYLRHQVILSPARFLPRNLSLIVVACH